VVALTPCQIFALIVKINGGKYSQLWVYKPLWPVITEHSE